MSAFSLLETMRLEDGQIVRLERHLARMATSASHFKYAWDEVAIRTELTSCVRLHAAGCWRVRLLVASTGSPNVECTPHNASEHRVWRVGLASSPIDPTDAFLLNKTTHRVAHDTARRARPDLDEVLLWNPRGEVTEATIANLVAEIDGVRYTPAVSCGLLAGTFRAELLEAGAIREQVLFKSAVADASRLWLINSLRGWIDAELDRGRSDR
jgi:para-aminobenzoate synthetase/4-amino-4-deoxychorismate lyase